MFQTGGTRVERGTFDLREILEDLFEEYDRDDSGYLDPNELRNMLSESQKFCLDSDQVDKIMSDFDLDGDGKIEYEEFLPIAVEIVA